MHPCILTCTFLTRGRLLPGEGARRGALSYAEGLGFLMGYNSALGRTATSSCGSFPSMP